MGKDVAEVYSQARQVFEEVDDALGESLSRLIWEGNPTTLGLTRNAQPALFATSMAVLRVMQAEGLRPESAAYVAGHSLGEYSALCAAGSLTISDAACLLRTRGEAMQDAVPVGRGAMAAVLGLALGRVQELAEQASKESDGQVCEVANDNDPRQVVISGQRETVLHAVELARQTGARRAVLLPVSAPFHCSLMKPAASVMRSALHTVPLSSPDIPVIANVTASPVTEAAEIRARLVEQVTGTVRWRESIMRLASDRVSHVWEIGPGRVLAGMIRRTSRAIRCLSVGSVSDIESIARASEQT